LEQVGEYRISAPRETVWAALNDPETLKKCIDGCQSMEQTAEDTFAAAVKAKIGPVSALFKADLTLADRNPPTSYAINASAKGGAAGFGKGVARVTLNDDGCPGCPGCPGGRHASRFSFAGWLSTLTKVENLGDHVCHSCARCGVGTLASRAYEA